MRRLDPDSASEWLDRARAHPRAERIERVALGLIGRPFRPQGRGARGLDCLGVAILAAEAAGVQTRLPDLPLRGVSLSEARQSLDRIGCSEVAIADAMAGDLLLQGPATLQVHLAVRVRGGLVEAHAGLRRVILRPLLVDELWDSAWRLPQGGG